MKDSIKQLDPIVLEWGGVCIEFHADLMLDFGEGRGEWGDCGFVKIGLTLENICGVLD